mmetsp:Transcript_43447/g.104972  ORF Transcript_43447/g.104972 Transcript_43447/m.104972 type:complete len:419 (+) Transcript_43447:54-1310(+)
METNNDVNNDGNNNDGSNGGTVNNHVTSGKGSGRTHGNQEWIKLVRDNLIDYNKLNKKDKKKFCYEIVSKIQETGGEFQDEDGKPMIDKLAILKTRACFINVNHRLKEKRRKAAKAKMSSDKKTKAKPKAKAKKDDTRMAKEVPNAKKRPAVVLEETQNIGKEQDPDVSDSDSVQMMKYCGLLPGPDGPNHNDQELGAMILSELSPEDLQELGEIPCSPTEDMDRASKSKISDARSAMTSVLIHLNQQKDQPHDIGKTQNEINMKVKEEDRTHFGKVGEERLFTGPVLDGKPHGSGTMTFSKGRYIIGNWVQGALSGKGTAWYPQNGSFNGTFFLNKRVGHGVRHYEDKSKFVGLYSDDKKLQGKYTYKDGSSLKGSFNVDGKLDGFATKTFSDGKTKMRAYYKNGQLEDEWEPMVGK